jgi:hypothetical protein
LSSMRTEVCRTGYLQCQYIATSQEGKTMTSPDLPPTRWSPLNV